MDPSMTLPEFPSAIRHGGRALTNAAATTTQTETATKTAAFLQAIVPDLNSHLQPPPPPTTSPVNPPPSASEHPPPVLSRSNNTSPLVSPCAVSSSSPASPFNYQPPNVFSAVTSPHNAPILSNTAGTFSFSVISPQSSPSTPQGHDYLSQNIHYCATSSYFSYNGTASSFLGGSPTTSNQYSGNTSTHIPSAFFSYTIPTQLSSTHASTTYCSHQKGTVNSASSSPQRNPTGPSSNPSSPVRKGGNRAKENSKECPSPERGFRRMHALDVMTHSASANPLAPLTLQIPDNNSTTRSTEGTPQHNSQISHTASNTITRLQSLAPPLLTSVVPPAVEKTQSHASSSQPLTPTRLLIRENHDGPFLRRLHHSPSTAKPSTPTVRHNHLKAETTAETSPTVISGSKIQLGPISTIKGAALAAIKRATRVMQGTDTAEKKNRD